MFIVAEFKSDAEETGFNLSFLKMSVLHEVDVERSTASEIVSEETVNERADSALSEIKKLNETPIEVIGFLSIFILMLLIALIATCINQCKKAVTLSDLNLNHNKIESELSNQTKDVESLKGSALERAKKIVIEVENQCTDPFNEDGYKPDEDDKYKDNNTSRSMKMTQADTARHLNESEIQQEELRDKKITFDDVVQLDCESGISDLNANHFFSAGEIANMGTISS